MITQKASKNTTNEYYGLSTDTKPVAGVPNASTFFEMDTGKIFMFDLENAVWYEVGA